jgi:hypothetical protein
MRRVVLSSVAVLLVAGGVVFAYLRSRDATLRGRVGRCSSEQRAAHPDDCRAIDRTPIVYLVGPRALRWYTVRVGAGRRFSVRVPQGRYVVTVAGATGAVGVGLPESRVHVGLDGTDVGTLVPGRPWTPEGVPGA